MRLLPRLTGKIYDWQRLVDFCAEHYIPFVFGHAVYMNEIFIGILAIPLRLFPFQQILQARERLVSVTPLLPAGGRCSVIPLSDLMSGMFVVVTVDTQQFPVAAVRRIVIVVVILVMDREFPNPLA